MINNDQKSYEKVNKLYVKKLGRPVSGDEWRSAQGKGMDDVHGAIITSNDYQQYSQGLKERQGVVKDISKNPVVGGKAAKEARRAAYATPYTEESFTAEYRLLNSGAIPDAQTIKNWVRNGAGVGQYTAEVNYDRKYIKTIGIDKRGALVTDPTVKAKKVYKVHTDAAAFEAFYGSGVHQLGEDRKGVVNYVPTTAAQAIGTSRNTTRFGAVSGSTANWLQQQFGLDPNQYSVTQVTRPAPKRGFFQHDGFHQIAQTTGIKEFDSVLGPAVKDSLQMAIMGPGAVIAAKLGGNSKYWNQGTLDYTTDPTGTWGNTVDENWSKNANQAAMRATNTSPENFQKWQAGVDLLSDAAILYFTGGSGASYIAAKHSAQAANRYSAGQGTTSDLLTSVAVNLGASYLSNSLSSSITGLGMGATSTAAAQAASNYGVSAASNKLQGGSWSDAMTNAAWQTAGGYTFGASNVARVALDQEYRDRLRESPLAWAQLAISTAGQMGGLAKTEARNKYLGGSGSYTEAVGTNLGLNRADPVTGRIKYGADWSGIKPLNGSVTGRMGQAFSQGFGSLVRASNPANTGDFKKGADNFGTTAKSMWSTMSGSKASVPATTP